MTKILAGHKAPDIALPGANGTSYSLTQALAKGPVVVAFYKSSCPVCQFTFPFLERLHKAYSDSAAVWGVSQDDARGTKEFYQEYGLTFPALVDQKGYPVSNAYSLTNVPTILLIAPDGKVKVSSNGFSKKDLEDISAELARHANKPVAPVFLPKEVIPDYKPG